MVVLGPRRVGKTVLIHQVVDGLLRRGVEPERIVLLTLDDVSLRGLDLGELLELVETRRPADGVDRYLLLDEVQHSPSWAGWLKRLADRRDPYRFLATGSSATALKHGGQDAGLGRWRELVLYPWSFREHVQFRRLDAWTFRFWDGYWEELQAGASMADAMKRSHLANGPPTHGEDGLLERALVDYLAFGGFPEIAEREEIDLREAQRHLRQDILDRALGRDIVDITSVDTRALERLFLRICRNPGGLWSTTEAASDIGVSAPTITRYVKIVEQAFLTFSLTNLASPIKGQPKAYLVAPSLRSALFNNDRDVVRAPDEWGVLVENAVAATAVATAAPATRVNFWRKGRREVDLIIDRGDRADYIEVERGGKKAVAHLQHGAATVGTPGWGWILCRRGEPEILPATPPLAGIMRISAVEWLYNQRSNEGGALRIRGH